MKLKELVQGAPLHHPSHPMFVHFPVAFYIGCLGLDVLSRVGAFPAAPLAGTWLLIGAFAGTILAATTGLVDWWGMVPGSRKRRWATWHMVLQLTTLAVFLVDFAVRWPDRHRPEAQALWIALDVVGVGVLVVAQWFGGALVYRMGMRVSTGSTRPD
jgi:uncharacterized membrane protein